MRLNHNQSVGFSVQMSNAVTVTLGALLLFLRLETDCADSSQRANSSAFSSTFHFILTV